MLQDTVLRLFGLQAAAPLVVSNSEYRFLVAERPLELGVAPAARLLEPVARSTTPAAALATLWVREHDPSGVLRILPTDRWTRDVFRFHDAVR